MENEYAIVGNVILIIVQAQEMWCDKFRPYIQLVEHKEETSNYE
jgi:hypothetical protein